MPDVFQNLLPQPSIIPCREFFRRLASAAARQIQEEAPLHVGFAIKQNESGFVEHLALATPTMVFVILVDSDGHRGLLPSDQAFEDLLSGATGITLVGFGMARLALHVHHRLMLRIRGVDLSTVCSPSTRNAWRPSKLVSKKLYQDVNAIEVDDLWDGPCEEVGVKRLCLRAWISVCVANQCANEVASALKVDSMFLTAEPKELVLFSDIARQADILEKVKPKETPNEFNASRMTADGFLRLENARYRNRVRRSKQAAVIMTNTAGQEYIGHARGAQGRTTTIGFLGARLTGELQSVRVVGRQDLTNTEKARDEFILLVLRGQRSLQESQFIKLLWFPPSGSRRRRKPITVDDTKLILIPLQSLNESQSRVATAMISDRPIVIAHGPPGTGKTTTIAAALRVWNDNGLSAWVVAHSNVAVKNMAEALLKRDVDFKIIVSKEFYVEWHEHIYERIQDMLLRADELPSDLDGLRHVFRKSKIVLSTLSMLSNPALQENGMFHLVPVVRLVVDEASQINIHEFLSVFGNHPNLRKLCMFGDPKQLPPHGRDTVPALKTIFDLHHLQEQSYFLDTQYRMPVPLGRFISQEVYDLKLHSEHKTKSPSCISLVNVPSGVELKSGYSWKNLDEIRTIIHLVRYYYRTRDFCVITPYDAQRAAIERALKAESLPWERVFNVDSFQGNEADYVLISVVRTDNAGFLTSMNRMNVMLTRCRQGMVIVTNQSFLHHLGGSGTLLGKLSKYWEQAYGSVSQTWVDWKSIAEKKASLPGFCGPSVLAPHNLPRIAGRTALPQTSKPFDVKALFRRPNNTGHASENMRPYTGGYLWHVGHDPSVTTVTHTSDSDIFHLPVKKASPNRLYPKNPIGNMAASPLTSTRLMSGYMTCPSASAKNAQALRLSDDRSFPSLPVEDVPAPRLCGSWKVKGDLSTANRFSVLRGNAYTPPKPKKAKQESPSHVYLSSPAEHAQRTSQINIGSRNTVASEDGWTVVTRKRK